DRNDLLTKLPNLPLLGLTALVTGLICRQLGGSPIAAWCAGIFGLTIPAQFCWAATTYAEPLLNFTILAAIYFVWRAWTALPEQHWRCSILGGLALGLAVGTKYNALYEAVLLGLIFGAQILVRRLAWRSAMIAPFCFLAAALLTGIWWLAVNAVVTG